MHNGMGVGYGKCTVQEQARQEQAWHEREQGVGQDSSHDNGIALNADSGVEVTAYADKEKQIIEDFC